MKYNRLGRTGLYVSEICFGTMTFSGENFLGGVIGSSDQREATNLISKCLKAGVNFFDTADVYSGGKSETMTVRFSAIWGFSAMNLCSRQRCMVAWVRE
jgi:aryl-alcohol dehydrogenase-like predicted oxidoreductase